MVKWYNSLQFRLTFSFVILILLITGFSYFYTYNAAKDALKSTIQDQLKFRAVLAANHVESGDLELFQTFGVEDDSTKAYFDFERRIYDLRKNDPAIVEYYIMKLVDGKVLFWGDDWVIDNPSELSLIGDEYSDYEPILLDVFRTGVAMSSEDFYTDSWGTYLSAYAPIKDKAGNVVAVIGLDMNVETVQKKIDFIGNLIYFVLGIAVLAAGLIIFFFSRTIIKDINELTKVSQKLSQGEYQVQLPEIKSKNEISELNEAMKSVMAALELLKGSAEARDKTKQAEGSPVTIGPEATGLAQVAPLEKTKSRKKKNPIKKKRVKKKA